MKLPHSWSFFATYEREIVGVSYWDPQHWVMYVPQRIYLSSFYVCIYGNPPQMEAPWNSWVKSTPKFASESRLSWRQGRIPVTFHTAACHPFVISHPRVFLPTIPTGGSIPLTLPTRQNQHIPETLFRGEFTMELPISTSVLYYDFLTAKALFGEKSWERSVGNVRAFGALLASSTGESHQQSCRGWMV